MAEALLNKILDKTAASKDIDGDKFTKYSKAYKKSAAFKRAGKTSKVNLELKGEMLAFIAPLKETANTVTIGWESSKQGGKAHGHITGGNKLPVRDFFGLNDEDIEKVVSKFADEIDELKEKKGEDRDEAIKGFVKKLDDG
jgi:hypothetical protein